MYYNENANFQCFIQSRTCNDPLVCNCWANALQSEEKKLEKRLSWRIFVLLENNGYRYREYIKSKKVKLSS
jgi:hypothetical protein